ncbi:MAG: hypothetical protein OJJ54_20265 [Pseudonocardia sp.]|nr:hypothetical protein [Pseudonocardia sp.]
MTSGAGELLADVRSTSRTTGRALHRGLVRILVGVAAVVTVLSVVAFAGAVVDDVGIARNRVVTSAEVLDDPGLSRTLIRFVDLDGQFVVPERGVHYPRGLTAGQTILVEYESSNPENVRVAGRTAASGLLPMAGGLLAVWLVFGGAAYWVRRRRSQDGP